MPKAVIVGGGIGGLTAALAFTHFGWEVEVLEKATVIAEVGAGLQISPNGMKVFTALGLAADVAENAFEPQALELKLGRSGQRVFSIPAGEAARRRWGAPYLHIHRADLIDVLERRLADAPSLALRLGAEVSDYETRSDGASVVLSTGETIGADLVIGADGIHSIVRTKMLGLDQPTFTGNLAWRAVVPMDELGDIVPPPTACVWAGPGRHAVTYRLRRGALANFVGVVERDDWREESWTAAGTKADMLSDFEGWHPTLIHLIEKSKTHLRWALFDRRPLPRWSDGCVGLLGDACHPTLPFLAQGAVMAIEDAYVLARLCAKTPSDIPGALSAYFRQRIKRTSAIQMGSRANMKTFHKRTMPGRLASYGPMWIAGQLLPGFVQSRQDWIYGHDVTA